MNRFPDFGYKNTKFELASNGKFKYYELAFL